MGAVFAALADPHRRRVVRELASADPDVEASCASFGLPLARSTQTHLFRVLQDVGLVRCVDHGNFRGVVLMRDDIERDFPGLLELIKREAPAVTNAPAALSA